MNHTLRIQRHRSQDRWHLSRGLPHQDTGVRCVRPRAALSAHGNAVAALLIGVFLLFATAGPVNADDIPRDLQDELVRRSWSRADLDALERLYLRASEQRLPVEGLTARVYQGVAQGVSRARILSALQSDLARLEEARELLAANDASGALERDSSIMQRTANLLSAGYSPHDIGEIAASSVTQPDRFRPGTVLYAEVIDWGAPPDDARALALAAIASHLSVRDFPRVPALLNTVSARRYSASATISLIVEELDRGRSIRQIDQRLSR